MVDAFGVFAFSVLHRELKSFVKLTLQHSLMLAVIYFITIIF